MKQFSVAVIVIAVVAFVTWFDAAIVFLLSGFIPGINVTLPPSTMIAVMIASTILVFALRGRRIVYRHCLAFYDELFGIGKKDAPVEDKKPARPRRRYQEL